MALRSGSQAFWQVVGGGRVRHERAPSGHVGTTIMIESPSLLRPLRGRRFLDRPSPRTSGRSGRIPRRRSSGAQGGWPPDRPQTAATLLSPPTPPPPHPDVRKADVFVAVSVGRVQQLARLGAAEAFRLPCAAGVRSGKVEAPVRARTSAEHSVEGRPPRHVSVSPAGGSTTSAVQVHETIVQIGRAEAVALDATMHVGPHVLAAFRSSCAIGGALRQNHDRVRTRACVVKPGSSVRQQRAISRQLD